MKHGGSKPPPTYSKYVNFNNFSWDCLILTYLVCIDSEFGTTGYINVHVSHKTITGVINGAFSQKVWGLLKYICSSHLKSTQKYFELENQFEDKVLGLYNNLSMMGNHSDKKIKLRADNPKPASM